MLYNIDKLVKVTLHSSQAFISVVESLTYSSVANKLQNIYIIRKGARNIFDAV